MSRASIYVAPTTDPQTRALHGRAADWRSLLHDAALPPPARRAIQAQVPRGGAAPEVLTVMLPVGVAARLFAYLGLSL